MSDSNVKNLTTMGGGYGTLGMDTIYPLMCNGCLYSPQAKITRNNKAAELERSFSKPFFLALVMYMITRKLGRVS